MATIPHPLTGVELNELTVRRASLGSKAALTACILRLQGWKWQDIAAALGTNTHRLGEVFRGEKYPEAQQQARALLGLS